MANKKSVNSDIYNLSQLVDDVKKIYIPEETDETLAIGMYGYIGALESHRLQTQVQMTGELSNESFPSRARLERNVITHAIMANIEDINAIPAKMATYLILKESDVIYYLDGNTKTFTIDRECPIYIGDYEFHLEYDIILKQIYIPDKNINTYSAQYSIPEKREVPTSSVDLAIGNPFISPPAIVKIGSENYIYITTTLSQVSHATEHKKLVTSNIIDNKTLNFEFEDQLSYFEVEIDESSDTKYLQPVFEGSNVPDNAYQYYCWYQYIDTNLIRIRFDRKSYMPGLNANIKVLIKTTKGSEGNFDHKGQIAVALTSDNYGYKNIPMIIDPLTSSANGRDRKSKSELQALIPKELLSRGSLTTITDLNNYFSTLDNEDGRIVIQKKIDNQIERVYYGYMVAKDSNNNIIPSNTIDVRVGLEDLVSSRIPGSLSDRYTLKPGACIKLDSSGVGYINHDPLQAVKESVTAGAVKRGELVTGSFKAKIIDATVPNVSAEVLVDGNSAGCVIIPSNYTLYSDSADAIEVEDYMLMSVGKRYMYKFEYVTKQNDPVIRIQDSQLSCLEFVKGYYYIPGYEENKTYFDSIPIAFRGYEKNTRIVVCLEYRLNNNPNKVTKFSNGTLYKELVSNKTTGDFDDIAAACGVYTKILYPDNYDTDTFEIIQDDTENWTINILQPFEGEKTINVWAMQGITTITVSQTDNVVTNVIGISELDITGSDFSRIIKIDGYVEETKLYVRDPEAYVRYQTLILTSNDIEYRYTCYIPSINAKNMPTVLREGDIIEFEYTYRSPNSNTQPRIDIILSEGLEYVPFSHGINTEEYTYSVEPVEKDIRNEGFIYTNPYAISINGYHLYSAFYMMAMDENPFLHYDYVYEKSNIQFIANNVYWKRDFLGENKEVYHLSIEAMQSVQEDLGIFQEDSEGNIIYPPLVKAIAIFYRDKTPYRYRSLNLTSWDESNLTFKFEQDFYATDIFDNDNNIKIENVMPLNIREDRVFQCKFTCDFRDYEVMCDGTYKEKLSDLLARFGISGEIEDFYSTDEKIFSFIKENEDIYVTMNEAFVEDESILVTVDGTEHQIVASKTYLEYGFMNPTTEVKIFMLSGLPDIEGNYNKYTLSNYVPLVDRNWTVTNVYDVVNGVTMYHNYSGIMGSQIEPYGTTNTDEDGNSTMTLEGYYIHSVPVLGYDYCTNEDLVQEAINGLNYRKSYIDYVIDKLENSFGIDFKLFNTYGPSHTYYIIRDTNANMILDEEKEYIDKVNLTLNFRIKLQSSKDAYTKDNIIRDIKEYMEDLNDLGELHIPNLVTQITNDYKEQIVYFEYLGFNSYGPDIQHIYKDDDNQIDIHIPPEFLNVANFIDTDGTLSPDINIYVSGM